MNLFFDQTQTVNYKSPSQIARVLTETWVLENLYCPRCGCQHLSHFPNNQAVADFYCPSCRNEYELKSKKGAIGKKVADGAYQTFITRITSNTNPDFFILSYDSEKLCVNDLWIVPKYFFVPAIVEQRKPLQGSAKRAGWIGCNILFDQIPKQGQIELIKCGTPVAQSTVMRKMSRAAALQTGNMDARGWLMDVLWCVNHIHGDTFCLNDVYRFENSLSERHPLNHNIRPKIRQQLQVLREIGFITFLGNGEYMKIEGL